MEPAKDNALIYELLYKQAAATERIENALVSNSFNNNRGLIAQVQEHEVHINELNQFKKDCIEEKIEAEKKEAISISKQNRNLAVMGLVFVVVQIAINYFQNKH